MSSAIYEVDLSELRAVARSQTMSKRVLWAVAAALATLSVAFFFPVMILALGDFGELEFTPNHQTTQLQVSGRNLDDREEELLREWAHSPGDADLFDRPYPGQTAATRVPSGGSAQNTLEELKEQLTDHQDVVYFLSALFLFFMIGIAAARAQHRVIKRHARIFWPRRVAEGHIVKTGDQFNTADRSKANTLLVLWVFLGFFFTWSVIEVLQGHGFAGGNLLSQNALDMRGMLAWQPEEWRGFLRSFGLLGFGAMVATIIALTAFGTALVSQNFPRLERALDLRDALEREVHKLRERRASLGQAVVPAQLSASIFGQKLDDEVIADFVACFGERDEDLRGIAPVARKMRASEMGELVHLLSRAMIMIMVLTLIVISLGLSSMDPLWDGGADIREATQNAYRAWLFVLGTGFTISAGLCYILPIMRLNPYIEAETNAREDPPGWDINLSNNQVSAKPKSFAPDRMSFSNDLMLALGADRRKFVTMMKGTRYGGGFHMVLDQGLWQYVLVILGLLSPTFTGGALSLFLLP